VASWVACACVGVCLLALSVEVVGRGLLACLPACLAFTGPAIDKFSCQHAEHGLPPLPGLLGLSCSELMRTGPWLSHLSRSGQPPLLWKGGLAREQRVFPSRPTQ